MPTQHERDETVIQRRTEVRLTRAVVQYETGVIGDPFNRREQATCIREHNGQ